MNMYPMITPDFNSALKGKFGKVDPGFFRYSMNGQIAVSTSNGFKTFDAKKNRLTNCNNFVFNIGEEAFFIIPTNHVRPGDIIMAPKPRYVLSADKGEIKTVNYETGTVETILPERHVFMGNTYFYGKVVSMYGNMFSNKKKGANKLMKMMMMSSLLGGKSSDSDNGTGNMLMAMMMMQNGGMSEMFDGVFDDDDEDNEEIITDATDSNDEETEE